MKKYAFLFLLCLVGMTAHAQTSLEDIDKGWAKKPINNVVNGSLGIMLPKQGKTLAIEEWTAEGRRRHIFTWNGSRFVKEK